MTPITNNTFLSLKRSVLTIYCWFCRQNAAVASAVVPRLLDCHDKRHFWLSYQRGSVTAGRGRYQHNVMLHYDDPDMTVRS